jgi:hypothetical protein
VGTVTNYEVCSLLRSMLKHIASRIRLSSKVSDVSLLADIDWYAASLPCFRLDIRLKPIGRWAGAGEFMSWRIAERIAAMASSWIVS